MNNVYSSKANSIKINSKSRFGDEVIALSITNIPRGPGHPTIPVAGGLSSQPRILAPWESGTVG